MPLCCPDVTGNSVRMLPEYALEYLTNLWYTIKENNMD